MSLRDGPTIFGNLRRSASMTSRVSSTESVDEDRALLAQGVDDQPVVDDLATDVDRRLAHRQRELDDVDRALDTRAESPGTGQQDLGDGCLQDAPCLIGVQLPRT